MNKPLRIDKLLGGSKYASLLNRARALMTLEKEYLDEHVVRETLGCFLKYQEDIGRFSQEIWADAKLRTEYMETGPEEE